MTDSGIYVHIPFCNKKCAYCDFYSVFPTKKLKTEYLSALYADIKKQSRRYDRTFDTVYIGGGSPSVLETDIEGLLCCIKDNLKLAENAEITCEVNPEVSNEFLKTAKRAGVNRISIGIQSGNDEELKTLGRTHTSNQAKDAVNRIKSAGFKNISADLMLALPKSNLTTLKNNLDFFLSLDLPHISAYMLKIEENTKFSLFTPPVPDDDGQAEQYLYMCEYLENSGYSHYEISNFAKGGFESRHNLKYWECKEYLGFGPSAHSFMDGKRFYFGRDIKKYISSPKTEFEGKGGEDFEKIMLGLRLKKGIDLRDFNKTSIIPSLEIYRKNGLIEIKDSRLSLTDKGMLLSNRIIARVLEAIYENL